LMDAFTRVLLARDLNLILVLNSISSKFVIPAPFLKPCRFRISLEAAKAQVAINQLERISC